MGEASGMPNLGDYAAVYKCKRHWIWSKIWHLLGHLTLGGRPAFSFLSLHCKMGLVTLASEDCEEAVRASMPKNPTQLLVLRSSVLLLSALIFQLFLYYKASEKYVFLRHQYQGNFHCCHFKYLKAPLQCNKAISDSSRLPSCPALCKPLVCMCSKSSICSAHKQYNECS